MTPGSYSLPLYKGDSYRWQFILWTDAAKTEPADLTDVVPKAEIRSKSGGTILATLTTIVEMPNTISMSLSAAACAALPTSGGVWDLQLTYPNGDVATILAGAVKVTGDVTDSAETMAALRVVS